MAIWRTILGIFVLALVGSPSSGAELIRLTAENFDNCAPRGKEADAIFGDFVLRNETVAVVVANPLPTRNANMTVRNVGGAIIDMTRRDSQSDQLSAFYPDNAKFAYVAPQARADDGDWADCGKTMPRIAGKRLELRLMAKATETLPQATLTFRLLDGSPQIEIETTFENPHNKPLTVLRSDSMRADRDFQMGHDQGLRLAWVSDNYWQQAYGVVGGNVVAVPSESSLKRKRPIIDYRSEESPKVEILPGEKTTHTRSLIAGATLMDIKAAVSKPPLRTISLSVTEKWDDQFEPIRSIHDVSVTVLRDGKPYGWGKTDEHGILKFPLDEGAAIARLEAHGRPTEEFAVEPSGDQQIQCELATAGRVRSRITDEAGSPIACKIAFRGLDGTPTPDFGPDTAEFAVRDLRYTSDGRMSQNLLPGKYEVIISHGIEYDAVIQEIEVKQSHVTALVATLKRSVDTTGWVSADFHSHSSPSGDNTSSQLGRVLNLLAEHIEFAPCTEHNRVSSYLPHLESLDAVAQLATCTGMELTGSPLPINHQNAFPLHRHEHTQDGGGPTTHADPVVQIERLAMWDGGSDKLVQVNHPYIAQMVGDRDANGEADGGFEAMFGWMDVIEVHPHGNIFDPPKPLPQGGRERGNTIYQWLQLLNLGYRIPGVVNTDAHYNHHGSGWIRNYIKSSTDDTAKIDTMEMVHASRRGNLVMTNGPFLEVGMQTSSGEREKTVTAGDDIQASDGNVTLHVRVQCPNWIDINRVQVFLNSRPAPQLNFTRKSAPDKFSTDTVKFDQQIPLTLASDTQIIVAVAGEGLQLGPVMGAAAGKAMPAAVSNPIFVDVDGGGFKANGDALEQPLPVPHSHRPAKRRKR